MANEKVIEHHVIIKDGCASVINERFSQVNVSKSLRLKMIRLCEKATRDSTVDLIRSSGICREVTNGQLHRVKRFEPITMLVFGIFVAVASLVSLIVASVALDRTNQNANVIEDLKRENEATSANLKRVGQSLISMEAQITQLQNALAVYAVDMPAGQDLKMEILANSNKKRYEMELLLKDWRNKIVGENLARVFPSSLSDMVTNGGVPIECTLDADEGYAVFVYRMKFADIHQTVYEASPFVLYVNQTTEGNQRTCVVVYDGPGHAIDDGKCVYALDSPSPRFSDTVYSRNKDLECVHVANATSQNYWRTKSCTNQSQVVAQVKFTTSQSIIYCPTMTMQLYKMRMNIACPDYPFALPFSDEFSVGDIHHLNVTAEVITNETITSDQVRRLNRFLYPTAPDDHFLHARGLEEAIASIEKADQDLKKHRAQEETMAIVNSPAWMIWKFAWSGPFGSLFASPVLLLIYGLLIYYICRRCTICRARPKRRNSRRSDIIDTTFL